MIFWHHRAMTSTTRTTAALFGMSVLLTALLYLPYLGTLQMRHEEPRRALVAEAMVQRGDYLVPVFMDRIYTAKPPLYNWLIAAVSSPFGGISEWTVRFASLLCLLALTGSMLWLLRHRLDRGGLLLLTLGLTLAPEMMRKGTLGEIDMCFALLVNLALWVWFHLDQSQRRGLHLWLLPGVIIALAFLAKREPAFAFYYLGLAAWLIYQRRLLELFRPAHLISAAITLAIVGLWIGNMIATLGIEAMLGSTMDEVVNRGMEGAVWGTLVHMLSYPFEVLLAMFPFSLLLLLALNRRCREIAVSQHRDVMGFAIVIVIANFPLYWVLRSAEVRYFLPMMPSILVICAILGQSALKAGIPAVRWLCTGLTLFCLTLSVLLVMFVLQWPVPFGEHHPAPFSDQVRIGLALAGLGYSLWLVQVNWRHHPFALALTLTGVLIVYRMVYLDLLLPREMHQDTHERDVRSFISTLYDQVPSGALPVGSVGLVPHEIWWYMQYGDITAATRPYLVTALPPASGQQAIARMDFRGRDIYLVKSFSDDP